jgi:hypothetical protein
MKFCIGGSSGTPDAHVSRHMLQVTAATTVLVAALGRSGARAGGRPAVLTGGCAILLSMSVSSIFRRRIAREKARELQT